MLADIGDVKKNIIHVLHFFLDKSIRFLHVTVGNNYIYTLLRIIVWKKTGMWILLHKCRSLHTVAISKQKEARSKAMPYSYRWL